MNIFFESLLTLLHIVSYNYYQIKIIFNPQFLLSSQVSEIKGKDAKEDLNRKRANRASGIRRGFNQR